MPSISSSLPALTYLALPPPSGGGTTGTSKATAADDLLNLPPVQPVQPVKRRPERADAQDQSTEANNGASGNAGTQSDRTQALQSDSVSGAASQSRAAAAQGPVRSHPQSGSTSGFVAQSLSQETLGSGLHIEPWQTALSSYRSAAALPGSASPIHLASLSI